VEEPEMFIESIARGNMQKCNQREARETRNEENQAIRELLHGWCGVRAENIPLENSEPRKWLRRCAKCSLKRRNIQPVDCPDYGAKRNMAPEDFVTIEGYCYVIRKNNKYAVFYPRGGYQILKRLDFSASQSELKTEIQ